MLSLDQKISVLRTAKQRAEYLATSSNGTAKKEFEDQAEVFGDAIELYECQKTHIQKGD